MILMEAKRITYNIYVFVLSLSHPLSHSVSPSHPHSLSLSHTVLGVG
jgi:hypothetical protein